MGLRELELKASYDSEEDDVLNDFYIPALTKAAKYRRLAGYYSSTSLAVAARGMSEFISNGGEMKLVVGATLRPADVEAINKGKAEPDKILSEIIGKDLSNLEDEFVKDHVKALAWLVAKERLDIKIVVPLDDSGEPLTYQQCEERGIFHQKVGILEDSSGDALSFSGSINETASAWIHNIEEFKVFRSWIAGDSEFLLSDIAKFGKYWECRSKTALVLDVPSAVKRRLVELAPIDFDELKPKLERWRRLKRVVLRDYQTQAIQAWFEHEKRGLIEMATGTGKTVVALGCLDRLVKDGNPLAVVISCPFTHLIRQWLDQLRAWGFSGQPAFESSAKWLDPITNIIMDLNKGYTKLVIIVTTHDTFASDRFITAITQVQAPILLISDEVHYLGAPELSRGLLEAYTYRIGLSATPRRWLDDLGTDRLFRYFGETIYEFGLEKAIPMFLVPYEYYPHLVEMTEDELDEYRLLTRKIARQYHASQESEQARKAFDLLSIERQQIVVDAKNKLVEFEKILDQIGNFDHCLIYCSPLQVTPVQQLLNSRGILQHKFTQSEDADERASILRNFDDGTYRALVAIKVLDEGLDVPSTRMAIILASSGNPKQFIQRRGRILRRHRGKEKAVIHDIIVVPTLHGDLDQELLEMERKILQREMRRVREFADISLNPATTVNIVYPVRIKYHLNNGP